MTFSVPNHPLQSCIFAQSASLRPLLELKWVELAIWGININFSKMEPVALFVRSRVIGGRLNKAKCGVLDVFPHFSATN